MDKDTQWQGNFNFSQKGKLIGDWFFFRKVTDLTWYTVEGQIALSRMDCQEARMKSDQGGIENCKYLT